MAEGWDTLEGRAQNAAPDAGEVSWSPMGGLVAACIPTGCQTSTMLPAAAARRMQPVARAGWGARGVGPVARDLPMAAMAGGFYLMITRSGEQAEMQKPLEATVAKGAGATRRAQAEKGVLPSPRRPASDSPRGQMKASTTELTAPMATPAPCSR